jgi:hypothetical protein
LASASAAGFFRARGFTSASAAVAGPALAAAAPALARVTRRAAGLTGLPAPGRILRAGILDAGRESASRAASSSTELLNVAASMPAAWSRSRTSLVVRRNLVARS